MIITEQKKELISLALNRHPGIMLSFCGDATNWDDCFTVVDFNNKKELVFWYNLPSGHTYSEKCELN